MKQIKILMELIDIFFKLFILGLVVAVGLLLSDTLSTGSGLNYGFDAQNFIIWVFVLIEILEWGLFLRGVYFLRKVARTLLLNEPFSDLIITSLKRSGRSIMFVGVLQIVNAIGIVVYELIVDTSSLSFGMDSLMPIFIIIIGLFFIIQSKALLVAKNNKEELDLVV